MNIYKIFSSNISIGSGNFWFAFIVFLLEISCVKNIYFSWVYSDGPAYTSIISLIFLVPLQVLFYVVYRNMAKYNHLELILVRCLTVPSVLILLLFFFVCIFGYFFSFILSLP